MVFQQFNLFPQYTAKENVMLAPKLLAKERPDFKAKKKEIFAQIESEAEDILKRVGLEIRWIITRASFPAGSSRECLFTRSCA